VPEEIEHYVPWGPESLRVPQRFAAVVKDARYPVRVEIAIEDGKPVCVALARIESVVRLDDGRRIARGPAITGAFVRELALDRVMREVVDAAAIELRPVLDHLTDEERAAWLPAIGSSSGRQMLGRAQRQRPKGRGAKFSNAELQLTAEVVRNALKAGKPTNVAVRKRFHVSRAAADRRISEARARGILEPAS
jgi:hypothetical protein